MRKEEFVDEDLSTADLAQGKRPTAVPEASPSTSDDRLALEQRLNDDRIESDAEGVIEDRAIRTTNDDRMGEDQTIDNGVRSDRRGPVLAERSSVESFPARTERETRKVNETAPLFPANELEELRSRWSGVQTAFVDEPRRAVEQADSLVASAMKRLAEVFAEERSKLEQQWDRGDNVSTEDLRIALQRYRSFFQRLLAI
jgi:hypothetical protein